MRGMLLRKETGWLPDVGNYPVTIALCLYNGIGRTNFYTCAAISAFIGIDNINGVTLTYCIYRTFWYTCAACQTGIVNFMGH